MGAMNLVLSIIVILLFIRNAQSVVNSAEGSGNSDELIEDSIWNDLDDKVVDALGGLDDELLTEHICNESTITQLQQEIILTTHNELRRSLAFGKQRNKRGLMNSARNMYKLDWDCELAALAANWSSSCPQNFMPQDVLGSNAQLFKRFYFYFDGHDSTVHMRNAMKTWWQQGEDRGNEDEKNRAQCEKEMIYENGKPCCDDKDCFTYPGSKCLIPEGLCQAPKVPKDFGESIQCDNSQVSDATRKWTLDQHNFYR
uniref:SCP domain-containing protein n=1 Tax=Caenorhabditis japonica TaxID=281687 RepID=A0A8R1E2T2_CAEJA